MVKRRIVTERVFLFLENTQKYQDGGDMPRGRGLSQGVARKLSEENGFLEAGLICLE